MRDLRPVILAIGLFLGLASGGCALTGEGQMKTPSGAGIVRLEGAQFEAFPLPDYAKAALRRDYKSYLVEVEPGIKVHVLESGSGYPIYAQHGAPTSGWLYRKVAEALPQDRFRVIMPTMVGLGFSSKVPASEHTLENHARWMANLLTQLELEGAIFVGHDWGGPVGMGALVRVPDVLEGAVILNTVLTAPTEPRKFPLPLRMASTPVLGEIVFERLVSVFSQLPKQQFDPDSMPPEVVELYERPVVDSGNSKGVLAILRMSADGPDHPTAAEVRRIEAYIDSRDFAAEIVWGMQDQILGARLDEMIELIPNAAVTRVESGHFIQEEAPEAIADALVRVLSRIEARAEKQEKQEKQEMKEK
ncbi:MAG: alpha/beta fold hydrolase [Myxococcota bacterium]